MTQVRTSARPPSETGSAYVYAILIDGMVRYIGKGRNERMYTHLLEACGQPLAAELGQCEWVHACTGDW
jgi:hypothetical protein